MKFKKICTKVGYLESQGNGMYNENTVLLVGRVPMSKVVVDGVIHSVSYTKCDVEIPDAIVNQYANITEISQ